MSHFTVMVIGDDVEDQLAPFQENNMSDCPKEFLKFNDIEDADRNKYETESVEMVKLVSGKLVYPWDELFRKSGSFGLGGDTHEVPANLTKVQVKYKDKYATFELFMKDWCGYDSRDEGTGRYGYWENPNARWDWYAIGGRWTGYFKAKDKFHGSNEIGSPGIMTLPAKAGWYDQLTKGNIDVDFMRKNAYDKATFKYEIIERLFGGSMPKLEIRWKDMWEGSIYEKFSADERKRVYRAQSGVVALDKLREKIRSSAKGRKLNEDEELLIWLDLDDFQITKEQYAQSASDTAIATFALVKDYTWYERGKMGWWGAVHNEKDVEQWLWQFNKMFDALPDDTMITVVDCHI